MMFMVLIKTKTARLARLCRKKSRYWFRGRSGGNFGLI